MDTFSAILSEYTTLAKIDPLRTWILFENTDLANAAVKKLRDEGAILPDHITTIKGLAKSILRSLSPAARIIDPEEQHLIFARKGADVLGKKRITDTQTENLVNLFITLKTNKLVLPTGEDKFNDFREIFRQYEQFCEEENCCDSILAIERAARIAGEMDIGTVLCYALYKPSPLAGDLLLALKGTIITRPPANENLTVLPEPCKGVYQYTDTRTELRSVLESIAALIESGTSPKEIALLAPSLTSALPLLDELVPDFSILRDGTRHPLRFTAGEDIPIENLPPVRCALAWLSAFAFDCKIEDLKIIIDSPYFTLKTDRLTAGKLEKAGIITKTEKGRAVWRTVAEQDAAFQASLDRLLDRLDQNFKPAAGLAEHCTALKADLSSLGWTSIQMKPQDEAARHAFLRLLDKLALTSLAERRYTVREFYAMLCRFCEKTTKISYRESETAFFAGDLRSVAGTKIPYVFITGLSSDRLPKIEAAIPLLNAQETARIQPDRVQNLLDASRYYFHAAALTAEKQLILSCAGHDGEKSLTPSPYLTRLAEPEPKSSGFLAHSTTANQTRAGKLLAAGRENECAGLFGTPSLETAAEIIGIETVDRTGTPGIYDANFAGDPLAEAFAAAYTKKTEFAPTVLERYRECPFKWYLTDHLRLENPADFSAERIIVGTVMHKAMERFFCEYTRPLTTENEEEATAFLKTIVTEEFSNRRITTPSWRSMLNGYLGEGGLESSCEAIIQMETGFYAAGFRTSADWLEQKVSADIPGDEPFTISGWVDRVMFNEQTREFAVIDYKTGNVKKWKDLEGGTALQIPLYTEAVRQMTGCSPLPGTYLKIAPDMVKDENPYLVRGKQQKSVEEVKDAAFGFCRETRENMKAGKCAVVSTEDCPDAYCQYRRICRFVPFREEQA
ncbi:MAG: PD-(D/E)XK nuclease family protein [Methanocorpusculum sp.]|uniref:PD-(D/E)XK nuclease family protein n=1 Tax=Methanocorpusculum sp. TaxID=2058474 RepID=UPI00271C8AD0|nr:PD-(D/E)XK nuclease family protein [Methanocorpusculum sp.]MDO9523470.1 PD-(D/E)XK nuclease family protein [Methanocorpusculum sp.]